MKQTNKITWNTGRLAGLTLYTQNGTHPMTFQTAAKAQDKITELGLNAVVHTTNAAIHYIKFSQE